MVACANSSFMCVVLFTLSCLLVSCDASFLSGGFAANRPLSGKAYLEPFRGRLSEEYCEEAIRSTECKMCAECNLEIGTCKELFQTDTCFPSPKEEICMRCFDEYGPSIFPSRVLMKASTKMAYRRYRRETAFAHSVDPATCEQLKSESICEECKSCMGEGSMYTKCTEYFKTEKCWPVPKAQECYECYEKFGPEIFPDM